MPRRRTLALVAALVFGFHSWRSSGVVGPFLFHDEFGYVAVTRWLAGPHTPELIGPLYHPGYGAMLVPVQLLAGGPDDFHTIAKLLNAILIAVIFAVAVQMGQRLNLGLGHQIAGGVAASMGAGLTLFGAMLVPEVLLALLTIGATLSVWRLFEKPSFSNALATGVLAAASYLTHPRGIVVVIALLLTVGIEAVRGSGSIRSGAGIAAGVALVGCGLSYLAVAQTESALYTLVVGPEADSLTNNAFSNPRLTLRALLGTSWYLAASTFGLATFGVVGTLRIASRQITGATAAGTFVILGVSGSAALSAVSTANMLANPAGARPDAAVYGRYVEHWVPVLVVLGVCEIVRRRDRWTMAGLAFTGFFVFAGPLAVSAYEPSTRTGPTAISNAAALGWFWIRTHGIDITRWGLVMGAVVLAIATITIFGSKPAKWLPVISLVVWGQLAGSSTIGTWASNNAEIWRARTAVGNELDASVSVAYLWNGNGLPIYGLQYWQPKMDIDVVFSAEEAARADFIVGTDPSAYSGDALVAPLRGDLYLWIRSSRAINRYGSLANYSN